ncbi:tetratricopeptide repeat-containing protein [Toxoplasma gondii MAS]|uniref:Tetratricopeptide repeat-containing protein n=1 Tax=Toxoplasma gondii MAS TaxID=943118 RepID=A0A086QG84_TOXGO|nr:tetratricopeptide repeat-containing protein [Toxoplasma gondii MAS]
MTDAGGLPGPHFAPLRDHGVDSLSGTPPETGDDVPLRWRQYEDLLTAAAELSGACGMSRQCGLFRDFIHHNIPLLMQLQTEQRIKVSAALPQHQVKNSVLQLARCTGLAREIPEGCVHASGNEVEDLPDSVAVPSVDGDRRTVLLGKREGTEMENRSNGLSRDERGRFASEGLFRTQISQMANAMKRARCASGCTHRALEVSRRLSGSPAPREPVPVISPACCSGWSGKDLLKRTSSSSLEGATQEVSPSGAAECHVGRLVEKVAWAWSCVVLQAPRQDAIHALFSERLSSIRQQPHQPLMLPPHVVGGVSPVPVPTAEEYVLIRLAAFQRESEIEPSRDAPGLELEFKRETGPRKLAARHGPVQARQQTSDAAGGSDAWANGNTVYGSRFEATEVGFCWYLLAMIYERDARTTAETAEERSVLRRCAAVCYFRSILAWPFMLQSWVRLVPLILTESTAMYLLSLLVHLREPCDSIQGDSLFHDEKGQAGSSSAAFSTLRDIQQFLFSPRTVADSAFFALAFPRPPGQVSNQRAVLSGAQSEGRELFVSILQRLAAVQLCMARGEARDALTLLEDWTLLPEGSSFLEEIIGCCYLQAGQPERGACFLLRSIQQYQLLEQEEECLRREEGKENPDLADEHQKEIAEASLSISLEPPEEAGCRCSSALWQVGRRRAATALVDWLLQRPRAQTTSQLWGAVGNLLSLHRKSDEALKALFRAVELADDYPYAYTLCAHELLQRNQREEAQALIEHGFRSRGLLKSLPLHALSLLLELQRHANAEARRGNRFSQNLNLQVEQEGLPTLPGCLADPATLRDLERLQHPQTLKKLAEQLLRIGQARRAYSLLLRAVRLLPGDGEIFYRLGCIKAAFQQYGEALQFLQRAAKLAPLDPDVEVAIACVYTKLLQPREAFWHLQAALRLTTDAREQKRISEQVMDLWSCSGVTDELLTGSRGCGRPRKHRPEGGTDPADEIYVDSLQAADTEITPEEAEGSRMSLPNSDSLAGADSSHHSYQEMQFHRLPELQRLNAVPLNMLGTVTRDTEANSGREWTHMWQRSGF